MVEMTVVVVEALLIDIEAMRLRAAMPECERIPILERERMGVPSAGAIYRQFMAGARVPWEE